MPTETELVNVALRKAGAGRIEDIASTVSPSAGVARDVLDEERDDELRLHTWNFAVTRVKLSRLATAPGFGFAYAYGKPADSLRIVSVHASEDDTVGVPYKLESIQVLDGYVAAILCDAEEVWLRHVRRVTDPNLMAPSFRTVLILRLARVFATSTANSNSLFELLGKELDIARRRARAIDGLEDYPERMPETSWVTARRGWP